MGTTVSWWIGLSCGDTQVTDSVVATMRAADISPLYMWSVPSRTEETRTAILVNSSQDTFNLYSLPDYQSLSEKVGLDVYYVDKWGDVPPPGVEFMLFA